MPADRPQRNPLPEKDDIELLRKRYQELDRKRTTVQAHLEAATKRLEELKDAARKQFGTDDLAELEKKLAAMKADNDRRRAEYRDHLDKIQQSLDDIERNHRAAAEPSAGE